MKKSKESKWTNIRAEKIDVKSWNNFLEKYHLGSLPAFAKNAIIKSIAFEKKRLGK